jgi:ABC-type molybdenum transport system ATPase subunit/photorepair protein PhrA
MLAIDFVAWTLLYIWLDGVFEGEGIFWFKNKVEISKGNLRDENDGSYVSTDSVLVENVTLKYGSQTAVKNVTLSIRENEIFVFSGQNGCGKTSMLNMISGLIK